MEKDIKEICEDIFKRLEDIERAHEKYVTDMTFHINKFEQQLCYLRDDVLEMKMNSRNRN